MRRNAHQLGRSVLLALIVAVAAWSVWGRRVALGTQVAEDAAGPVAPVALGPPTRVPTGIIVPYAGSIVPNGWLLCDGSEVSRATYDRLFGVIGTTYGDGDGATTFNLPDLRQRFALGRAASGTGSTLGEAGGAIDHTHGAGSYRASGHTHGGGSYSTPSHTHSLSDLTRGIGWNAQHGHGECGGNWGAVCSDVRSRIAEPGGGGAITGESGSAGDDPISGTSAPENPPYLVVNYLIKA